MSFFTVSPDRRGVRWPKLARLGSAAHARELSILIIDVDVENRYGGGAAEGLPEERS
jgi:hypothetical protein